MRYFHVDKVTELVVGERIAGIKNISLADEILHDHFPDLPVFPGALIVEAAAQLSGLLLEVTVNGAAGPIRRALLVRIQDAKFHRLVGPGDQLELSAAIDSQLEAAGQVRVEARVAGELVLNGRLTFSLREIDCEAIHEQRRKIYALWTRELKNPPPLR